MASYSIDHLPTHGMLYAFVTATAVEWGDSGDSDDYTEEHGYVDTRWSMRELYESRNYVRPFGQYNPATGDGDFGMWCADSDSVPTARAWMEHTLRELFGSVGWEDNGDGTFYGADAIVTDYSDPRNYTYALHFHVKHSDPTRGWVEDEVTL